MNSLIIRLPITTGTMGSSLEEVTDLLFERREVLPFIT